MSALAEARREMAEAKRLEHFRFTLAVLRAINLKERILAAWRDGIIPDDRAEILIDQFGLGDVEAMAGGA